LSVGKAIRLGSVKVISYPEPWARCPGTKGE
jgi:hypothetical protein